MALISLAGAAWASSKRKSAAAILFFIQLRVAWSRMFFNIDMLTRVCSGISTGFFSIVAHHRQHLVRDCQSAYSSSVEV